MSWFLIDGRGHTHLLLLAFCHARRIWFSFWMITRAAFRLHNHNNLAFQGAPVETPAHRTAAEQEVKELNMKVRGLLK